jgi:preprotein translocase subunit SecY
MAMNLDLSKFGQATELKNRLWFTLGALVIFRFLSFVPLPGVDPVAMNLLYSQTASGGILDLFNTFSGGSLERMSIIALGVMPYITASIVVQLAAALSPTLAALKKEGEAGRKKLNQYTRYGTVFLTIIQGYFIATSLEAQSAQNAIQAVVNPGLTFQISAIVSLVGGTLFLMWLGEQITSRGIGNGVSLIIMAGSVATLPRTLAQLFEQGRTGAMSGMVIVALLVGLFAVIWFISFSISISVRLIY